MTAREQALQNTTATDPRPLIGEPLALDLLNTCWVHEGEPQDLLTSVDGLAIWLSSAGLADRCQADEATLRNLRAAREAIAHLVDGPADTAALKAFNDTLAHGRLRLVLGVDGPDRALELDETAALPSWLAAENYLTLLGEAPDRIRHCAHPDCVLHFYDTSRNGTRRWCSMAICGNRAKASRHYTRHRNDPA
ncbi:MAG: CGNR zinc finger domain-containing protein [Streptomyces sp.]|jgi:predicted RNA-binding Zn ribbon-like protein|nr:CGNR zinc finger domain-containing protein [Streptomyces sp.]